MARPLPAMRIKSRWFKGDAPKSAAEQASVMAFIVWRVSQQMLLRMRGAQFDIDAGPPYFAFLREVLAFLIAVTDRLAFQRLDPADAPTSPWPWCATWRARCRRTKTACWARPVDGAASHADTFIDLVNELSGHYAEFPADPAADEAAGFQPGFAFVRYLGSRLEPTVPDKDRRWVLDQVMAIETPEAWASCSARCTTCSSPMRPRARRAPA
jgi:hypothetical protein